MRALIVALVLLSVWSSWAVAGDRYNDLEDAAVAEARVWQQGGRAHPIMSSDGKVIFAYGQSMPKLTCSPTRACDVEMEPGEKVKKIVLGDGVNWVWNGAESEEAGKTIQHVVFQPRDVALESNAIIFTDHRSYHIKLFSPAHEGAYLNRVGFYYPQELVTSWEYKDATDSKVEAKAEAEKVMPTPVAIDKLDFNYRITGSASFKPLHVFNDGQRVFLEMPNSLRVDGSPVLMLLDGKGEAMVVNYRREEDPATGVVHYVVDKLFSKAELRLGSDKVDIAWQRQSKTAAPSPFIWSSIGKESPGAD